LKRDVRFIRNQSLKNETIINGIPKSEILNKEVSEQEKDVFKKYVQDYLKTNNLKRPKDIYSSLDEISEYLEQVAELRKIAGNGHNFRILVRDAIGMG
jgi:hypothetical protein